MNNHCLMNCVSRLARKGSTVLIQWSLVLLCMLVSPVALAGLNHDLNDFFQSLGNVSNVSSPSAYEGQRAGFYSGGSLFLRHPVQPVSIAEVELPRVQAGCGGLDIYTGGFSFINGRGMKTLMQNILHGASGYVTELALEQTMPQATNVMRHMQDIAHQANQFNLNACHAASQRLGARTEQLQESQQQVCQKAAIQQGRVSNWTQAQQLCAEAEQANRVLHQAKTQGPYQAMVFSETNLVWKALRSHPLFQRNTALAELMMTLSGSLIITEHSSQRLPARAHDTQLINTLLHGGKALVYHCDTLSACLHPRVQPLVLSKENALANQTVTLLQSMTTKIKSDTPLSEQEQQFLQTTSLPLYKFLNIQAVLPTQRMQLDIASLADFLAVDLLTHTLTDLLHTVSAQLHTLSLPASVVQPLMQTIADAAQQVQHHTTSAYQRMQLTHALITRTQLTERMLASTLATELQTQR